MKILLTGAHFTPAIAVAQEIKKLKPDVNLVYVGRNTTLEGDKTRSRESVEMPKIGVKFIPLIAGRLQRRFTIYTIPSLLKIPIGLLQSIFVLLTEKPDVILSFGGYISVPIVVAGWLFSIPIIIHEQTMVSGLANKISSYFASKIAISFLRKNKDQRVILTGNPIRKDILFPTGIIPAEYNQIFQYAKTTNMPVILVLGGNQGSHTINQVLNSSLDKLLKYACIIHQTGESKFHDFEELKKLKSDKYLVRKWIGEEIGEVLSKSDLVISRAGANTLSELAYLGIPALVIPFEPLYHDEQNKNAKYFENLGLVKILSQSKLTEFSLIESVESMLRNLAALKKDAENAKSAVLSQAAKTLALETLLLARQRDD